MENERVMLAIGRIERALSRVEAAKDKLSDSPQDEALQQRHAALKDEMKQAIHTIDGLIARQEH